MKSKKASLLNSRSRLQRIKDAKFFSGWIKAFDDEQIHVQLGQDVLLELGDVFMIEVYGSDTHAVLKGRLGMVSEGIAVFSLTEQPRYLDAKEPVRIKVEGVSATLTLMAGPGEEIVGSGGVVIDVEVNDVSHEGAGLLSPLRVERGSKVSLSVDTPAGPVDCRAEVRYCKSEADHESLFRIGVLLEPMGRLEIARWTKMIDFSLDAA